MTVKSCAALTSVVTCPGLVSGGRWASLAQPPPRLRVARDAAMRHHVCVQKHGCGGGVLASREPAPLEVGAPRRQFL